MSVLRFRLVQLRLLDRAHGIIHENDVARLDLVRILRINFVFSAIGRTPGYLELGSRSRISQTTRDGKGRRLLGFLGELSGGFHAQPGVANVRVDLVAFAVDALAKLDLQILSLLTGLRDALAGPHDDSLKVSLRCLDLRGRSLDQKQPRI